MPQKGGGTIRKRGRIWWVQVCVDGQVTRQSSRSEKYEDAVRLRNKLLGQKVRGELGGRIVRPTVNGLLDYFLKCLKVRVRPATFKIQKLVLDARLRSYFGNMKGDAITSQRLLTYREQRAEEGAKASTINRELSLLRNCLRTAAHAAPALLNPECIPRFPITNEDAFARQGFLEDAQFDRLRSELPEYLEPLAVVAYNTGIRKGELLKVEWEQVDFSSKVVRLYRGATKTGDPRTVPMIGNMEQVLLKARTERDQYWPDCPWVFNRLGDRLKDFRGAWESACDRAGINGLLFHDLRRSGARNLSRAGVPERTIMAITGHKTRAMFDRYNIVSESDLADAADKMKTFRETKLQSSKLSDGRWTPISTDTISDTVPKNKNGD
jgi:integrase